MPISEKLFSRIRVQEEGMRPDDLVGALRMYFPSVTDMQLQEIRAKLIKEKMREPITETDDE